jgi:tight adherence protein C
MIDPRLAVFLLPLLALATLMPFCARILLGRVRFDAMLTARFRAIHAGPTFTARGGISRLPGVIAGAAALGGLLMRHRLLPRKTVHEAEILLAGANLRGESVLAGFVGGKVLLLAGLPPLFWGMARFGGLADNLLPIAAVSGAAVALVLPDVLLGRRRRRRLVAIESGLPDALDLLVICVDAGLAFESALERVAREIAPVHAEVAEELAFTVNALRISPDRHAVLKDMGERLEVDFLRQLAATLAQSLQIGAPLSRALRQLAQELRREQLVRVEARAAKLPVLLTIPMVIFIMPTVLIIVGGPAVIQIMRTF